MAPRNILSLTHEEKRQFLDSFDHVFSDIDGVVWNMTEVFEGSAEGFKQLREVGKQLTFITNNSLRQEEECLKKLLKNNIEIDANNLWHPAKIIAEYLKSIKFEGLIYALASDNFKKVLQKEGFTLMESPNVIVNEFVREVMACSADKQPIKAVIIDFDYNISYLKMMKANFYLRQPDCMLICGATDSALPITNELSILGPGPFSRILEETSGKKMLTFGKPGKEMAEVLMQRFHIPAAERVLMIGDMLEQDIRFATSCGFQSLLILSGICSYEHLMTVTDENVIPKYYAHSMVDIVEFMRDVKKNNI